MLLFCRVKLFGGEMQPIPPVTWLFKNTLNHIPVNNLNSVNWFTKFNFGDIHILICYRLPIWSEQSMYFWEKLFCQELT